MKTSLVLSLLIVISLSVSGASAHETLLNDSFKLDGNIPAAGKPFDKTPASEKGHLWAANSPSLKLLDDGAPYLTISGPSDPAEASTSLDPIKTSTADYIDLEASFDLPTTRDDKAGRYLGLALSRAGDAISVNGCLWINLGLEGHWALMQYQQILKEGQFDPAPGKMALKLEYRPSRGTAKLILNDVTLAENVKVPPPMEQIGTAIVHFQWCDSSVKLRSIKVTSDP